MYETVYMPAGPEIRFIRQAECSLPKESAALTQLMRADLL